PKGRPMQKIAILAAATATIMSVGVAGALAQTDDAFTKADANHDGFVTMEEAMGIYSTLTPDLFAKADANGDQKLDQAEYTALVGLTAAITSDKADSGASSSSAADTGASSGADTSSSSSQTNP
ncbi:MAG TPA: EF-hand domain-containing protein, partial [Devosia sp.]|nr:EF-hand domain-containing protein [Devosia sp.]